MTRQAKIIGTGSYLPERILSNQDLEKMVETSDEWIVSRTGMKERRLARADEYPSQMGSIAAQRALEAAGIAAEEVDFILVATLTPDYVFPSTACLIQKELGAKKAAALDIQAACTGYLYALSIAKGLILGGGAKHILVIAAEKLSAVTDYQDRSTCILFGDGAAACLVSSEEGRGGASRLRASASAPMGSRRSSSSSPPGGAASPLRSRASKSGNTSLKCLGMKFLSTQCAGWSRRVRSASTPQG